MLVKMAEVLVNIAVMMMAPGSAPAPPEAREGWPPFFFFFLDLLPRWEKGFPSGPWLPWRGRGEIPSEIGSISLFLRSLFLAFRRFLNSRRSVTLIGLKFGHYFIRILALLRRKRTPTALRSGHEGPGRAPRACVPLGHRLALIIFPKNHNIPK